MTNLEANATAANAAADELILRMERTFAAPRASVFRAWTDPEQLVKWWGPRNFEIPVCEMDLRQGGAWRTCMRDADGGEHWVGGVYREIVAPERLVFTWAWENDGVPGHETLVTIDFGDLGDKTRLTLTQEIFESGDGRVQHQDGWSSSFDCLDDLLSGGEAS